MKEPKEGIVEKRDSPPFDPLAIAIDEKQRNGIKRAINEHQKDVNNQKGFLVSWYFGPHVMVNDTDQGNRNKKINPHLTRSTGVDRGEKRR